MGERFHTALLSNLPLKGGGRRSPQERAGRGSVAQTNSHFPLTPTPTLPLSGGGSDSAVAGLAEILP